MSCLNSTYREELVARLEAKEAQLAAAEATYLNLLGEDIREFRFNSGEGGNQWAKYISLDMMRRQIDRLEKQIAALRRKLRCGGVMRIDVRRNGG